VFLRIATLTLAQALDLATFAMMVGMLGPSAEANPLVGSVYGGGGMALVVALKVALVILVGSLAVAAALNAGRRIWGVVGGLPVALAIAVGLIGSMTNAATILR
jgi:hypothetical protein